MRSTRRRSVEGVQAGGAQGDQAKAMADLDASLMQRLDEDSATNHKLLESLRATQVGRRLSVLHLSLYDVCGGIDTGHIWKFITAQMRAGVQWLMNQLGQK